MGMATNKITVMQAQNVQVGQMVLVDIENADSRGEMKRGWRRVTLVRDLPHVPGNMIIFWAGGAYECYRYTLVSVQG